MTSSSPIRAIVTGHTRGPGAALAEQLLARNVTVMGLSRCVNLIGNVDREYDFHATRQRRFPTDQTPCRIAVPIFSTLDKGRLNAGLGAQQVFPLVPGGIPRQRQRGLIEHDFALLADVSVDCVIVVESALPQRHSHAPRILFRQK